jgi:hypothetical protein
MATAGPVRFPSSAYNCRVAGGDLRKIFCPEPCPARGGGTGALWSFHVRHSRPAAVTNRATPIRPGQTAAAVTELLSSLYSKWPVHRRQRAVPGAGCPARHFTGFRTAAGRITPGTHPPPVYTHTAGRRELCAGQFRTYPALALSARRPAAAAPAQGDCRWSPAQRPQRRQVALLVSTARWCWFPGGRNGQDVCRADGGPARTIPLPRCPQQTRLT